MLDRQVKSILTERYVTDVVDDNSTDDPRILMEYNEEIHRHPREYRDIRGAIEPVFGELCAMGIFQPVTIEFQALNVTYEFTLNGEWMERYEPGTGKPSIELSDVMVRIFDSGEVLS